MNGHTVAEVSVGLALGMLGGKWRLPVHLPAGVGGRVIRIRSEKEAKPFAVW